MEKQKLISWRNRISFAKLRHRTSCKNFTLNPFWFQCSSIWRGVLFWWSNFIWVKCFGIICNYGSLQENMWPLTAIEPWQRQMAFRGVIPSLHPTLWYVGGAPVMGLRHGNIVPLLLPHFTMVPCPTRNDKRVIIKTDMMIMMIMTTNGCYIHYGAFASTKYVSLSPLYNLKCIVHNSQQETMEVLVHGMANI